jgi:hypothetical protein
MEEERLSLEEERQSLRIVRQNLADERRRLESAQQEAKYKLRRLKDEWEETKARIETELLEEQIQKIVSKRAERELVGIQSYDARCRWYSKAREYAQKLIARQRSEQGLVDRQTA